MVVGAIGGGGETRHLIDSDFDDVHREEATSWDTTVQAGCNVISGLFSSVPFKGILRLWKETLFSAMLVSETVNLGF